MAQSELGKLRDARAQFKGKVESLRAACASAVAAKTHAEETLNVQKVAAQAMLQRLQSRSAECTACTGDADALVLPAIGLDVGVGHSSSLGHPCVQLIARLACPQ